MTGRRVGGIVAASVAASVLAGCVPSAANPFPADGTVDMVVCLKPGADAQSLIDGPVLSRPSPPNALEGREVAPGVEAIRADPAHHAIDISSGPTVGPTTPATCGRRWRRGLRSTASRSTWSAAPVVARDNGQFTRWSRPGARPEAAAP